MNTTRLLIAAFALAASGLSVAAPTTLPSGVMFEVQREGKGPQPKLTDTVVVHYRGTLTDGKEFDSSYSRGVPTTFPLRGVIPCWTEAMQALKVGSKAKIVCPSNTAYGETGIPGTIPPKATLVFDVELLDIKR